MSDVEGRTGQCDRTSVKDQWIVRSEEEKLDALYQEELDNISDGFHTFKELYEHRAALFIALMCQRPELSWWSPLHHDGTMLLGGWIIAGMQLSTGQVTYHLRGQPWRHVLTDSPVPCLERAPEYDGHRPVDVIDRLMRWVTESLHKPFSKQAQAVDMTTSPTTSATVQDGATLRRVAAQIDHDLVRDAVVDGRFLGGLHLAVMTGPFLNLIVAGHKTVESRFHRQRRAPFLTAHPGHVVVFRQSGRPATVAAVLGATSYLDITESGIEPIRATWASRIGCDDDDFWAARADARWVSLLQLDSVFSIPSQSLHKRDRQAWVTYPYLQEHEEI